MALDSRRKRSRSTLPPTPAVTSVLKKKKRRPRVNVPVSTPANGSSSSYGGRLLRQVPEITSDSEEEECRAKYLRVKTSAEMEIAAALIVKANKRPQNTRPTRRGASSNNQQNSVTNEPIRTTVPLYYGGKSTVSLTLAAGEVDADLIEMLGNTPNALLPAASTQESTQLPPPSSNGKSEVDRYFVRNSGHKGWVSCVACGELQWPPNREKHLAKCPGLRTIIGARA